MRSTETKPESQNVTANSKAQELFQALVGRVQHELRWARTWWIIIGLLVFSRNMAKSECKMGRNQKIKKYA